MQHYKDPSQAIEQLTKLYYTGCAKVQEAVEHYLSTNKVPTQDVLDQMTYPVLKVRLKRRRLGNQRESRHKGERAPGIYAATFTHISYFSPYLLTQCQQLAEDFDLDFSVGRSTQRIPYVYALEAPEEVSARAAKPEEFLRIFQGSLLSRTHDEVVDGISTFGDREEKPLSFFNAVRTDYSLQRLVHYTGTSWQSVQPWVLLTNYHRYVDHFLYEAYHKLLDPKEEYTALVLPGNIKLSREDAQTKSIEEVLSYRQWQLYQMPAYHLVRGEGSEATGMTLINIGVGPSNAKTITDHLAVLRPYVWLMIGHCGGLSESQKIGDYVLAHGYLRCDGILDDILPTDIPLPALSEVQNALHDSVASCGHILASSMEVKHIVRTGTVVSYADRNWELRFKKERARLMLARAIAVDMESGTIAAQGYRMRVPYGTLLCVSDKPLHGELKMPGSAHAFYERAIDNHLKIGMEAIGRMQADKVRLNSRKLRSIDDPPLR